MTTYNAAAVTNAVIAFKKAVTLQLLRALRDNPIAMFEGAAGAPRLARGALNSFAAGDTIFATWPGNDDTSSSTYITSHAFNFIQSGTVRVTFTQAINNSANTSFARIMRTRAGSDTEIISWSTSSTSGVDRSADVDVIHGDILSVQHRSGSGQSTLSLRRMRNDGTLVWDLVGGRSAA